MVLNRENLNCFLQIGKNKCLREFRGVKQSKLKKGGTQKW